MSAEDCRASRRAAARPQRPAGNPQGHKGAGCLQADCAGAALIRRRRASGPAGPRHRHLAPTTHRCLHEGLTVLADHAPDLSAAPERATAAGYTHLDSDGTVSRTDQVAAAGPDKTDPRSGKHKDHRGNVQVFAAPDGWPLWASPVRPGWRNRSIQSCHEVLCKQSPWMKITGSGAVMVAPALLVRVRRPGVAHRTANPGVAPG